MNNKPVKVMILHADYKKDSCVEAIEIPSEVLAWLINVVRARMYLNYSYDAHDALKVNFVSHNEKQLLKSIQSNQKLLESSLLANNKTSNKDDLLDYLVDLGDKFKWPDKVLAIFTKYGNSFQYKKGAGWEFYCKELNGTPATGYVIKEAYDDAVFLRKLDRHNDSARLCDGQGLPPVGCECQYRKHKRSEQSEWFNGVVKYASEFTVVIQAHCYPGETVGHPVNFEFRPIRSEDDEKRDDRASAIDGFISGFRGQETGSNKELAYALTDYLALLDKLR
ncbi:TPA: hypothetical protein RQO74_000194 [Klebsiella michiganensis]|nr:hypothetical protein [Klebsiella michiganensis]